MPKKPVTQKAAKPKAKPALAAFMQSQQPAAKAPKVPAAPTTIEKAAQGQRRALRDGRVQTVVYMHPDGIKELKRAVLDDEAASVTAAVSEAINAWLVLHKRPPVA